MKNTMIVLLVVVVFVFSGQIFASDYEIVEENFIVIVEDFPLTSTIRFNIRHEIDESLIAEVSTIQGVDFASKSSRYCLSVYNGKAFSLEATQREVAWVLKKHFKGENMIMLNPDDYNSMKELNEKISTLLYKTDFMQ